MSQSEHTVPMSEGNQQISGNYKARIYVLSIGFFFVFMSFNAAQALATSLSEKQGHIDLAALYGTFGLACIFAPKAIDVLGPRLSIILGGLPYVAMISSSAISSSYYVSVPLNVLVGLGAPLLWTGQGVYLSRCAQYYGIQNGISKEKSLTEFNGFFWTSYQLNGTVGLVMSSLVLTYLGEGSRTTLFYILGGCATFGVLILTTLSDVPRVEVLRHQQERFPMAEDAHTNLSDSYTLHEPQQSESEASNVTLCETLKLLANPKMYLFLPLVIYNGLSLGFLFGDFTQDGSSKVLGVDYTGFVIAAFFLSNALATQLWSYISGTSCGRRGVCIFATLFHVGFYTFFYLWTIPQNFVQHSDGTEDQLHDPTLEDYAIIFGGSVVFAIGDAVWESQVPAILQSIFDGPDVDASLANLKLWQSLGFATQFFVGIYLEWDVKITILAGWQILGVLGLLCMHVKVESIDEPYNTDDTHDVYHDYNPNDYTDHSHDDDYDDYDQYHH